MALVGISGSAQEQRGGVAGEAFWSPSGLYLCDGFCVVAHLPHYVIRDLSSFIYRSCA